MAAAKTQAEYVALVGLNYPTAKGEIRVEAGEACADIPTKSVAWLREQGLIGSASKQKPKKSDDAAEVTAAEEGDE